MQALRICDVGLPSDASLAFHSMLHVVEGRARAAWHLADFATADVLFAHAGCDPATIQAWNSRGKPVVLVIDDRNTWPANPFVLRYPFRVMQLLSMLDSVSDHLRADSPKASTHASWAGAESLRGVLAKAGERGWQISRASAAGAIWIGERRAYATADTLARLRAGALSLHAFEPTAEPPPVDAQRMPVADLAWLAGLCVPPELAPWLDADTAYQLRRWPDFGRLHAVPRLLELCAEAAVCAHTPAELAARCGGARADVYRFLAAASLGGLLAAQAHGPVRSHAPRAGAVRPGWMRFVADLRRHLTGAA